MVNNIGILGNAVQGVGSYALPGALLAFFVAYILFSIIILIGIYIYTSLALMKIARKTRTEPAWLAWIPIANVYLISKIAKMHWWPILLLLSPLLLIFSFLNPLLGILAMLLFFIAVIVFAVFSCIWMWKVFEAVGKPGWWILFSLIPFAGGIIFLVLLGVAAWSK